MRKHPEYYLKLGSCEARGKLAICLLTGVAVVLALSGVGMIMVVKTALPLLIRFIV